MQARDAPHALAPSWWLCAVFSAALVFGCASIKTGANVWDGFVFEGMRTYALRSWPSSPYPGNEQARRSIDDAIHRVLQSKGLVAAADTDATLWVSYTAGRSESHIWEPWKAVRERPTATRVARRMPNNSVVMHVLNIHVADARTQRIVWEGWGEAEIRWDDLTNQVLRIVRKILEPFPSA